MDSKETIAFQILGISEDTEFAAARKTYRRLVKIHHPDKGGTVGRFQKIQAAWEVIKAYYEREPVNVQYAETKIHVRYATYQTSRETHTASETDRCPEGTIYLIESRTKNDIYIRYAYIYVEKDKVLLPTWVHYKRVDPFRYVCLT